MDASELKSYIIENNKTEDVLLALGCHKLRKHNGEIRCALPNHSNPTSVCVKLETLSVIVYSDDLESKGDIYTFIMDLKKIKFVDAVKYIHNLLGLEYSKISKPKSSDKTDVLSVFTKARAVANAHFQKSQDLELLDEISNEYIFLPHISWIREGILPFACDKFNIGYDIKTKRILIPHRLWCGEENDYVGIIGRTTISNPELFDVPKYFPLKPYPKSLNVYGLQENYRTIQEKGYVVVVESEKGVLKRYSKLDGTCVAICGHNMSLEQTKILISLNVDIIIAMDRGIDLNTIRGICESFYNIRNVYYLYDKDGKYLKDKESPSDLSDAKFYDMLREKILYDKKEHELYLKGSNG
jgi:DNA primase